MNAAGFQLLRIDHVQLAMPAGQEARARAFYAGILGLTEIPKPANLARRGGVWFQGGDLRLHLGVEDDFHPARKAHPAFLVRNLDALTQQLEHAGVTVITDEPLEGYNRVYVSDPFGNRLELLEPARAVLRGGSEMTNSGHSWTEDVGRLLLRLAVGGLMLFHGIQKMRFGVDYMFPLLEARGLPGFIAYGSYFGEVVSPVLILVGVLSRFASLAVAGTMVMAVYLALSNQVLALNQSGGWAIELNALFFLGALAIALLGPGRFHLWNMHSWWLQ
jgi:uncharacterized membrane protein YphA (DoxX/SURF4 family)